VHGVMMEDDLLEEFLHRDVRVQFAPGMIGTGMPPHEEGILYDYSASGILLEQQDGSLVYIPYSSLRLVQIKPKPTLWQRLTGTT
jgi:hypothetical protein